MENRELSREINDIILSGACGELENLCEYGGMTFYCRVSGIYWQIQFSI
jgi:hypothetical protein